MTLGQRLYELRKAKQLSQEEAAEKLNVTRQTVSKWETDQSTPDFNKVMPICELYGISVNELFTGEKEPGEQTPSAETERPASPAIPGSIPMPELTLETDDSTTIPELEIEIPDYDEPLPDFETVIPGFEEGPPRPADPDELFEAVPAPVQPEPPAPKKKKKRWLVILIVVLVCLLPLAVTGVSSSVIVRTVLSGSSAVPVGEAQLYAETFDTAFTGVEISSEMGDVKVIPSDSGVFRVTVFGVDQKVAVDGEKDSLTVEVKNRTKIAFLGGTGAKTRIEVRVPENYAGKLAVRSNLGNIVVGELPLANVLTEVDFGEVLVEACARAEIINDCGDISVSRAETGLIQASAGNITVGSIEELDVENSLGNIEISSVNGYLRAENSCGNISVGALTLTRDSTIHADLGNVEIGSADDIYVDASCELGKVDVRNSDRKADHTLKITNSCGNITVKN